MLSLGFSFSNIYAQITPNNAFILEGSGFGVTEEIIQISEINLTMTTKQQSGSSIQTTIEDGFITLGNGDYLTTDLKTTFLRDGKYIRINGNVESELGEQGTVRFFGRLIEESKSASIYGFTGRITTEADSYKIIYTAKLSTLSNIEPIAKTPTTNQLTINILKGASSKDLNSSYIGMDPSIRLSYFSKDRISVEPGTTITFVNNDVVSHSLLSGKENFDRYTPFTPDGRISTADIGPGKSISVTFDKAGFYRLFDPDYPWVNIVAYVFPNIDSVTIGQPRNPYN